MRVGLFWLGPVSEPVRLALDFYGHRQNASREYVVCAIREAYKGAAVLPRVASAYPFATINDLVDVYHFAEADSLDFALINFGNGVPVSPGRLNDLLHSSEVQQCIWSFRVAHIVGIGFKHSPRFPFVDEHFIILNVQRARDASFFDRTIIHASHSEAAGGLHAHLTSMIEYSVAPDELNNHFFEDGSRDAYGRRSGLDPFPFHLCETTGFMACYPEFNRALLPLVRYNLPSTQSETRTSRWRYKRSDDYYYLRSWGYPLVNRLVTVAKNAYRQVRRREFRKVYRD